MKPRLAPAALALLATLSWNAPALAHHGVAGVGAAAVEGPGSPIESSSSAVLPAGSWLTYLKLDHAQYKKYAPAEPEADYARYWMTGVGYGFTPWFSAYLFAPYHDKTDEPGGYTSRGWADLSVMGQLGFRYDAQSGWQLTPAQESLDDLEDWHFTLFGGATLPTGNANARDSHGEIDPGKSRGFGKPSFSLGLSAAKMLTPRLTLNLEASAIRFQEYTYADGQRVKFGEENRLSGALNYRLLADADRKFRLDGVLEAQFLHLGRDKADGVGESGTGGRMVYLMPGVRAYVDRVSLALGIKKAVWTRLNESHEQQGAEGKEKYRVIFSASYLF